MLRGPMWRHPEHLRDRCDLGRPFPGPLNPSTQHRVAPTEVKQSTPPPELGSPAVMPPPLEGVSDAEDYCLALGQIVQARARAKRSILIWGILATVAALVSLASYASTNPGDRYVLWWGPVVFGVWRMIRAALVLFRLRNV